MTILRLTLALIAADIAANTLVAEFLLCRFLGERRTP